MCRAAYKPFAIEDAPEFGFINRPHAADLDSLIADRPHLLERCGDVRRILDEVSNGEQLCSDAIDFHFELGLTGFLFGFVFEASRLRRRA